MNGPNKASTAASAPWVVEAIPVGTDPASGAEIVQLTSEPVTSTNVYCEQRYASADGTRIAIDRRPFGRPAELWVCDLRSLRLRKAAEGTAVSAHSPRNAIYYIAREEDTARVMRLDLVELTTHEMARFAANQVPRVVTISPDEHWLVGGPFPIKDNLYSLRRTDLTTQQTSELCEIADITNPHLQFDPADGQRLMVQINRTGRAADRGPAGATLALVDVETGTLTPLPVGVPHTRLISGHECWAGPSGRLLFTAAPGTHPDILPDTGLYSVTPGAPKPEPIVRGQPFNHLAVSDDGRFFIVDNYETAKIYIGSIATGRFLELCDSHTRLGKPQYTHPHAYMTPGNQYVIFDSVATGVAQVYAARIPEGFLEKVLAQ